MREIEKNFKTGAKLSEMEQAALASPAGRAAAQRIFAALWDAESWRLMPFEQLQPLLLQPSPVDGWSIAHLFARNGFHFNGPDIVQLGDPVDGLGLPLSHIVGSNEWLSDEEIALLGNPVGPAGIDLRQLRALSFPWAYPVEELMRYQDTRDPDGRTPFHIYVARGYFFPIDVLEKIGNPVDGAGDSVGHLMARKGHAFSLGDLERIGNPANQEGMTIAHLCVLAGHRYSVEAIEKLGNPVNREGDTIAHLSALRGFSFTFLELVRLNNPRNQAGKSVTDIMRNHGLPDFTPDQWRVLNDPDEFSVVRAALLGEAPDLEVFARRPDLLIHYGQNLP